MKRYFFLLLLFSCEDSLEQEREISKNNEKSEVFTESLEISGRRMALVSDIKNWVSERIEQASNISEGTSYIEDKGVVFIAIESEICGFKQKVSKTVVKVEADSYLIYKEEERELNKESVDIALCQQLPTKFNDLIEYSISSDIRDLEQEYAFLDDFPLGFSYKEVLKVLDKTQYQKIEYAFVDSENGLFFTPFPENDLCEYFYPASTPFFVSESASFQLCEQIPKNSGPFLLGPYSKQIDSGLWEERVPRPHSY